MDIRRRYGWWFKGTLVLLPIGLALDVFALQQEWISLQSFRIATGLVMIGFFGVMIFLVNRLRKLPEMPGASTKTSESPTIWIRLRIWSLKALIAMMMISLLYGNWVERGAPLLPRLVGSVANIGMTWLIFKNLRPLERRKQSTL
jgi:hypothetical protein